MVVVLLLLLLLRLKATNFAMFFSSLGEPIDIDCIVPGVVEELYCGETEMKYTQKIKKVRRRNKNIVQQ